MWSSLEYQLLCSKSLIIRWEIIEWIQVLLESMHKVIWIHKISSCESSRKVFESKQCLSQILKMKQLVGLKETPSKWKCIQSIGSDWLRCWSHAQDACSSTGRMLKMKWVKVRLYIYMCIYIYPQKGHWMIINVKEEPCVLHL